MYDRERPPKPTNWIRRILVGLFIVATILLMGFDLWINFKLRPVALEHRQLLSERDEQIANEKALEEAEKIAKERRTRDIARSAELKQLLSESRTRADFPISFGPEIVPQAIFKAGLGRHVAKCIVYVPKGKHRLRLAYQTVSAESFEELHHLSTGMSDPRRWPNIIERILEPERVYEVNIRHHAERNGRTSVIHRLTYAVSDFADEVLMTSDVTTRDSGYHRNAITGRRAPNELKRLAMAVPLQYVVDASFQWGRPTTGLPEVILKHQKRMDERTARVLGRDPVDEAATKPKGIQRIVFKAWIASDGPPCMSLQNVADNFYFLKNYTGDQPVASLFEPYDGSGFYRFKPGLIHDPNLPLPEYIVQ